MCIFINHINEEIRVGYCTPNDSLFTSNFKRIIENQVSKRSANIYCELCDLPKMKEESVEYVTSTFLH
jgi:hypothetical protein